jgi:hypothetical protein
VDGGVRANNPSWEAKVEGVKHWRTRKRFIVSVGTVVQKPVDFIGKQKVSHAPKVTESVPPESVPTPSPRLNAAQITRIPGGVTVAANIVKALVNLSTSSESTHLRVWEEAHSQDEATQFPYFRFNVQRGMDEIGLEEWQMAEAMADVTRSYLESPDVKHELENCAVGLLNLSALEGM